MKLFGKYGSAKALGAARGKQALRGAGRGIRGAGRLGWRGAKGLGGALALSTGFAPMIAAASGLFGSRRGGRSRGGGSSQSETGLLNTSLLFQIRDEVQQIKGLLVTQQIPESERREREFDEQRRHRELLAAISGLGGGGGAVASAKGGGSLASLLMGLLAITGLAMLPKLLESVPSIMEGIQHFLDNMGLFLLGMWGLFRVLGNKAKLMKPPPKPKTPKTPPKRPSVDRFRKLQYPKPATRGQYKGPQQRGHTARNIPKGWNMRQDIKERARLGRTPRLPVVPKPIVKTPPVRGAPGFKALGTGKTGTTVIELGKRITTNAKSITANAKSITANKKLTTNLIRSSGNASNSRIKLLNDGLNERIDTRIRINPLNKALTLVSERLKLLTRVVLPKGTPWQPLEGPGRSMYQGPGLRRFTPSKVFGAPTNVAGQLPKTTTPAAARALNFQDAPKTGNVRFVRGPSGGVPTDKTGKLPRITPPTPAHTLNLRDAPKTSQGRIRLAGQGVISPTEAAGQLPSTKINRIIEPPKFLDAPMSGRGMGKIGPSLLAPNLLDDRLGGEGRAKTGGRPFGGSSSGADRFGNLLEGPGNRTTGGSRFAGRVSGNALKMTRKLISQIKKLPKWFQNLFWKLAKHAWTGIRWPADPTEMTFAEKTLAKYPHVIKWLGNVIGIYFVFTYVSDWFSGKIDTDQLKGQMMSLLTAFSVLRQRVSQKMIALTLRGLLNITHLTRLARTFGGWPGILLSLGINAVVFCLIEFFGGKAATEEFRKMNDLWRQSMNRRASRIMTTGAGMIEEGLFIAGASTMLFGAGVRLTSIMSAPLKELKAKPIVHDLPDDAGMDEVRLTKSGLFRKQKLSAAQITGMIKMNKSHINSLDRRKTKGAKAAAKALFTQDDNTLKSYLVAQLGLSNLMAALAQNQQAGSPTFAAYMGSYQAIEAQKQKLLSTGTFGGQTVVVIKKSIIDASSTSVSKQSIISSNVDHGYSISLDASGYNGQGFYE